jgi:glutamate racemase
MKIGICDWGIGGVGLYQLLTLRSNVDVIYFSDTGYTPYGKVPEAELLQRLEKVFDHLKDQGANKILVGCNAASTVLKPNEDIIGIIDHGVNLVLRSNIKEVGIVGGKRTIESEIYKTLLEQNGLKVHQRIAQPLSARIEAGDVDSLGLEQDIAEIFGPIKQMKNILLACTHYPLINHKILEYTGDSILLDPAEEMVNWIFNSWEIGEGHGEIQWQTSGDTLQMKNSLEKLYGINTNHIQNIQL